MPQHLQNLGILKPVGGGDPVPLRKTELTIGRRASCDIVLDFDNVSGKHCQLRYINQVWHVRDLASTNGTKVNGSPLTSEHTILPDDELAIATHIYTIDYEPGAPTAVLKNRGFGDEEVSESPRRHSLMELAGVDTDDDRPRKSRPQKAPAAIERPSADEAEFDDALPEHVRDSPAPAIDTSDDDFFKMIEEEVPKKPKKGGA